MSFFELCGRKIGDNYPPFMIAEMSGNHNQSLDKALKIVEAAAACGAHGLKIQTYTADTMTLNLKEGDFLIKDPKSLWNGYSLYELYQKAHTPWDWHQPIFKRCRDLGMVPFSTPFDATAVDFLEDLGVELYKIASFEVTDLPLIEKVGKTRKPMIISTGMASKQEIRDAVDTAQSAGCPAVVLLKCTSSYPASPHSTNISTIPDMKKEFGCYVGLSDHTMGIGVAVASVALGAQVIEKHLTLDRSEGGVDSAFSLEPQEFKSLVVESGRAFDSLGQVFYGPTDQEKASVQFRRSLYVAEDLRAGEKFSPKNLRIIRPGIGLPPKYYSELLGKAVKRPVKKGTPVSWDLIES